jgi:hypothetical protein
MSEIQIDPQLVIQNLVNEVTRLTVELAISRAAFDALNSPIHVSEAIEE